MDRSLAKRYLDTVIATGSGDKVAEIIDHDATAVFDMTKCTWTIQN